MRSILFVTALLCAAAQAAPRKPHAPDLAASASFLPSRFVVDAPEQRVKVRKFLEGMGRDSSETFSLIGNILKLSPALEERLAAEEGGATEKDGGRSRRRARLRLERVAGAGIEEEGYALPADYLPNDMSLQSIPQWALQNDGTWSGAVAGMGLNMGKVWEQFDGDDTLVVAVLDAGYNFMHPDLQNRWYVNQAEANGVAGVDDDHNGYVDDVRGWDFVDADNDPQDYHGHGTATSSLIAATFDNGIGMAGMLPRVRILPVRVLSTVGYGTTTDIANGIRYAAAMGVDAINFSIGIGGTTVNTTLRNAFIAARDSGVLIAAAAANDHADLDAATTQPASYKFDNVYMVASHNQLSELSGFSNYGATTVDLAAPGEHVPVAETPPPLPLFAETFENFSGANWSFFPANGFAVVTDSIEGSKGLRWQAGVNDTIRIDTLDLRNRRGGQVSFALQFTRANSGDRVLFEAQSFGATKWDTLVNVNVSVSTPTWLAYNLGRYDGTLCRLRFRTYNTATATNRVLRIDDIRVKYADLNPANQDHYEANGGGTSFAAPYVAGYAALMRLATRRMGIPLTRSMMLAGSVPNPNLAGKVITGGRLDVAKGLDFYLRTLPRITVSDTSDTAWNLGAVVGYALGVSDSAGPKSGYAFSAINALPGGSLSSGGEFSWTSGSAPLGGYTLRAKAQNGPITLRKSMRFTLIALVPVAPAEAGRASLLRVGGRAFLLPPSAFLNARNALRIELYAADGRTIQTVHGDLEMPRGARGAEYRLAGAPGAGLRVWLNGTPLRPAARD